MNETARYKFQALDYPVFFGDAIWDDLIALIKPMYDAGQLFVLTDENTFIHCLPVISEKVFPIPGKIVYRIPPGELSKDVHSVKKLWRWLQDEGAERDALLLNLGGGVVSDLGGFVAGTYKRGMRFLNVPTSLLGQGDAAIGGKTGINLDGVKNAAGLFVDPVAVFIAPTFLATLPDRHLKSGFAELIKCAFLAGDKIWEHAKNQKDTEGQLNTLLKHSVQFKCEVVAQDPLENGRRKILNFGHTIGHAMESISLSGGKAEMLHGEAVAAGMICEAWLSKQLTGMPEQDMNDLIRLIRSVFSLVPVEPAKADEIWQLIRFDKKVSGRQAEFILMAGPGRPVPCRNVNRELISGALEFFNLTGSNHADSQTQ